MFTDAGLHRLETVLQLSKTPLHPLSDEYVCICRIAREQLILAFLEMAVDLVSPHDRREKILCAIERELAFYGIGRETPKDSGT